MGSCSSAQKAPASIMTVDQQHTSASPPNLMMIDHLQTFADDDYSTIESIQIFSGKYIKGVQVNYSVNLLSKKMDIMGTGTHNAKQTMKFSECEYIDHLILYHDRIAITGIHISTTKGNEMFFGNETNRPYKREVNLKGTEKVVVGFRGVVGEYLTDLEVYQAQIDKQDIQDTISSLDLDD